MTESICASRQRLRPWLIAMINSGHVPGLCWLNAEKTKFRIPWKHAGKQDWNPSYSQIFMEWAKHTGSYREGIDKLEYVKWKTRLRCALHKANDIEYVKRESETQEDIPEPYRVYELRPQSSGKRKAENSKSCASVNLCNTQTAGHYLPCQTQEAPVPKMVTEFNDEIDGRLPSDLTNLDSAELRQWDNGTAINVDSCLASMSSVTMPVASTIAAMSLDIEQLTDSMSSITFDQATLNNAQKTPGVATFAPAEDHLIDLLQASNGCHNVGGPNETDQIVFSCADGNATATPQPPVNLATTMGVSFSQPAPFQPSMAEDFCAETMAVLAPNGDYNLEQFVCVDLQDMLISDDFS